MGHTFIGLGNPGDTYRETRHNIGARMLEAFRVAHGFSEWKNDKTKHALMSKGDINGETVVLVFPQTFMNQSGLCAPLVAKTKKAIEHVIVIYDDLDLPRGYAKISFGRSSGGHNGLESVINGLKTKDFIRVRVGVSPITSTGKIRKPKGEKKVLDFLLGTIGGSEEAEYKKIAKHVDTLLLGIIEHGWMKAASMQH